MKVKTLEQLDGSTVESWEDRGPTRADVLDDVATIARIGSIEGTKLA